jgi:hypothetical protein
MESYTLSWRVWLAGVRLASCDMYEVVGETEWCPTQQVAGWLGPVSLVAVLSLYTSTVDLRLH